MLDSSDEEDPYAESESDVEEKEEPPLSITGLTLAEHYFGPLMSPVAATPAQWTAYTAHRRGANAEYKNVFSRRKRSISDNVATIEKELGLDDGTLQKCVSILGRDVEWDEVEPRDADILVRIYSLATPKYVDVHIKYHCRARMDEIEWCYSIGYKVYNRISGLPTDYHDPSTDGPPFLWHSRGGWQSICWGYYDDEDNYPPRWRRIEVANMSLHEEGVFDVHEALFGPIETPSSDNGDALLAYRRKLVTTVRLLLAALGIDYEVACTDDESDTWPRCWTLEGLADRWVARGIRAACGFQLSHDAEAARRGQEKRREYAANLYYEEEDEDSEEGGEYTEDEYEEREQQEEQDRRKRRRTDS